MTHTSIFDGLPLVVLKQRLTDLQMTLFDLSTGSKGESYSYSQGDGARSVTNTKAKIEETTQTILAVQKQIDRLEGRRVNRVGPMWP
ncbi:MAG: hypothetical protein JWR21_886 [Herminiimonas sp.]|nr:hypothetical protein [Herminiimonas sp.]